MYQKIKMIIRGNWYRYKGKNQKLYHDRMSHCLVCPYNSSKAKKNLAQKLWSLLGDFCMECGCFLEAKTREPLSECPLLKWEQAKENQL